MMPLKQRGISDYPDFPGTRGYAILLLRDYIVGMRSRVKNIKKTGDATFSGVRALVRGRVCY